MPGACSVGGAAAAEECWKPSDRTKWGWRTGLEFMTMEMCAIRQHPGISSPSPSPLLTTSPTLCIISMKQNQFYSTKLYRVKKEKL